MKILIAISFLVLTAGLCGRSSLPRSPDSLFNALSQAQKDFSKDFSILPGKFTRQMHLFTKDTHPLGSKNQFELGNEILLQLKAEKISAQKLSFKIKAPNPVLLANPNAPADITLTLDGHNIAAFVGNSGNSSCVIIVGSHYDTKRIKTGDYLGANDSASSSVLLLELVLKLSKNPAVFEEAKCSIMAVWFDGEESYLDNWYDGERRHPAKTKDHTYGSRNLANMLRPCKKADFTGFCTPPQLGDQAVAAVVVVDMIGSKGIRYTREATSNETLRSLFELAVQNHASIDIMAGLKAVDDDHTAFVNLGIPSLNIIDFENLQHWHQPTDTTTTISPQSIDLTGKILTSLLFFIANNPQVIGN